MYHTYCSYARNKKVVFISFKEFLEYEPDLMQEILDIAYKREKEELEYLERQKNLKT